MPSTTKEEKDIAKMFDSAYSSIPEPAKITEFDESLRFYFDYIMDSRADSVLDVGMGAGGLLLALQNHGIKQVYGVELSSEGVNLAKRRFELFGDPDRAEFYAGNFLDYSIENVDILTLHRVIHCYPDYKELIEKCIKINPEYILITLPRDTLIPKIFLGFLSVLSKPITGFRAYVHPTDEICGMLKLSGYKQVHFDATRFWETRIFSRTNLQD